jgi:hypothetical protein
MIVIGVCSLAYAAGAGAADWGGGVASPPQPHFPAAGHRSQADPVQILLKATAIERQGSSAALEVEATSANSGPDVFVLNSIGVYDELGNEYVPQTQGRKRALKGQSFTRQKFEVPSGLPDGYYEVKGLFAFGLEERDRNPTVRASSLFLQIESGEITLIDAQRFAVVVHSHPGTFGEESE